MLELAAVIPVLETTSPSFAVPEASTMSLVLPRDGGLNGAGPDAEPARSQGLGGGVVPGGFDAMVQVKATYGAS